MILHRCCKMLNFCKLLSAPKLHYSSLQRRLNSSSSLLSSSSSSCSRRIGLFPLNQPIRNGKIRFLSTSETIASNDVVDRKEVSDTFFAGEGVDWESIGISDRISRALSSVGIDRPSLVQAACVPSILSGKDVVIAAETGSGKTYAYLVPLFEKLSIVPEGNEEADHIEVKHSNKITLVLCPNVMLCEQVVRMANALCGDDGKPLLKAAAVCGRQGWPIKVPDIIVSTPAALLNNIRSIEEEKRRRIEFIRCVKHVVFDEADLLLCGSFQNQVIRLIDMFRFEEKQLSRMKKSLPEGEESLEIEADTISQYESADAQAELMSDGEEELEGNNDDDGDDEDVPEETESGPLIKRKDWRRERKVYERTKQYIFVAATLPVNGKRTAGGTLKRMFPDANWVSGVYLHCHNPRLEQHWIEVTIEEQVGALVNAVNQSKPVDLSDGVSRTIVFANTVEAVEAVTKILQGAGIKCLCYHSDGSLEDRAQNLIDFQENGGILVCTDAASRGLDIPNISHVIQADFATSALDFLHRIGRTGRAGQYGRVTSLYTEANRDLVNAIREAWKQGQPVEVAFSRKRSFRKKIKKKRAFNRITRDSSFNETIYNERVLA